jgi:hypothetical protein
MKDGSIFSIITKMGFVCCEAKVVTKYITDLLEKT